LKRDIEEGVTTSATKKKRTKKIKDLEGELKDKIKEYTTDSRTKMEARVISENGQEEGSAESSKV
jgi:hypothetical protein